MPQGVFTQRIAVHRRQVRRLRRISIRRHYRAAVVARMALFAQKNGRPQRARNLMQRALRLKAAAGRAGVRAQLHGRRIAQIRRARALQA